MATPLSADRNDVSIEKCIQAHSLSMLANHKGEVPFVVLIVPFLVGVSLALTVNLSAYHFLLLGSLAGLLITFIMLNVFYGRLALYKKPWLGGILMHILLLLAGACLTVHNDSRNADDYFVLHFADALLIKVGDEPQLKSGFLRFTADVISSNYKGKQHQASGKLLVTIFVGNSQTPLVGYGDELLIPAKYTSIDPQFNPAEFNYKQYLAHQNIYKQAFVDEHQLIVFKQDAGNPIVAYALKLRRRLVEQFRQYMHNPQAVSVASTLILGYKAELDGQVLSAYSETGTIHVLSVSGAHVAIIFWIVNLLFGFLDGYRHGKTIKAIIVIGIIWWYALLTGLSPAVCRAAVMISFVIIGKTYYQRINTLNVLAASAMLLLLIDPFLLTDAGFQLSYLAVAGLIVFQPIVYGWLDIENKWLDKIWLLCSASIAAQAITFPLSAYYFHQFPVYFLVSNLFILLPSFIIMCAGMVFLLTAQPGIPVITPFVAGVLEQTILFMNKGLQLMTHAPYALMDRIWINYWGCLLLFAVVILLFYTLYYRRCAGLTAMLICLLLLSVSWSNRRIDSIRTSEMTFFNVKKHTAMLFRQGHSAVLLTDMADTDKAYRYSIKPCLDSDQVTQLRLVSIDSNVTTRFMIKRGGLIRFLNKNILIVNKRWINYAALPGLHTDYLLVTDNPRINMDSLNAHIDYGVLIANANNSDKEIALLKTSTDKCRKKISVLKRNKSLVVVSE
jgi:competence protein ComEC